MKLVKEHIILEKFTEDSDPIKDMGIGTKYIWKNIKAGDIFKFKKFLQIKDSTESYPQGSYIRVDENEGMEYNCMLVSYSFFKNKEDLLTNTSTESGKWGWPYEFFKEYFEIVDKKSLKESLNEKFTEDSDPIKDLNIGMQSQLKKWVNNIAHLKDYEYDNLPMHTILYLCVSYNKYDFVQYLLEQGVIPELYHLLRAKLIESEDMYNLLRKYYSHYSK